MRGFAAASQGRALRARRVGAGGGRGVTVYALDSGVRATHQEFAPWGGGASRAAYGCARVAGAAGGPPPCLRRSREAAARAVARVLDRGIHPFVRRLSCHINKCAPGAVS